MEGAGDSGWCGHRYRSGHSLVIERVRYPKGPANGSPRHERGEHEDCESPMCFQVHVLPPGDDPGAIRGSVTIQRAITQTVSASRSMARSTAVPFSGWAVGIARHSPEGRRGLSVGHFLHTDICSIMGQWGSPGTSEPGQRLLAPAMRGCGRAVTRTTCPGRCTCFPGETAPNCI